MNNFPAQSSTPFSALAFDFGTQRIGVAFGQSLTGSAKAVAILKVKDGIPRWQELEQLIELWQPDIFVVGLPYHMDGSEGTLLQRARKFGNRLHGRYHKPCYGMDERLSSIAAAELQQDRRNQSGHGKQGAIDDLAAQIILQDWFRHWLNQTD